MARKCLLCPRWIEDGRIYCSSCKKNVDGGMKSEQDTGSNNDNPNEEDEEELGI